MNKGNKGSKFRSEPKDAFDTMDPINQLLKIFCGSSLSREQTSRSWLKPILTFAGIIVIVIIFTVYKIVLFIDEYVKRNRKILYSDLYHFVYIFEVSQYIIDFSYVFKFSGRIHLSYFKVYDQIDKVLGMKYYVAAKATIFKITSILCTICSCYLLCDIINWYYIKSYDDVFLRLTYTIEYFIYFKNTLTIIEMCANIVQIQYRLETIRNILEDIYCFTNSRFGAMDKFVGDKTWLYHTKEKEYTRNLVGPPKSLLFSNFHDIVWLNKCYLLLIEQNHFINKVFGVRMLLNNIFQLLAMIYALNTAVRIIDGKLGVVVAPLYSVFACMLSALTSTADLICLAYHCERTYDKRDKIIAIVDHILVDKNISSPIRTTLTEFRGLVYSRPIRFTAANVYQLNFGLLVTFCSVLITFTVILLQNL